MFVRSGCDDAKVMLKRKEPNARYATSWPVINSFLYLFYHLDLFQFERGTIKVGNTIGKKRRKVNEYLPLWINTGIEHEMWYGK